MKTLTVNGNTLVLEEVCPECFGNGEVVSAFWDGNEDCKECHGTGVIKHHYTPDQYKEITGEEWPEDGPVWEQWENGEWHLGEWKTSRDFSTGRPVVIATAAGKPPADYRP